jgi:hypothetical protein
MPLFVLIYEVVDNYVARRAPYRGDHLFLVEQAHARGELLQAGALGDPVTKALLVWRVADKSVVEEFVKNDPYNKQGLIKKWEILPWTVVLGEPPLGAPPAGGKK